MAAETAKGKKNQETKGSVKAEVTAQNERKKTRVSGIEVQVKKPQKTKEEEAEVKRNKNSAAGNADTGKVRVELKSGKTTKAEKEGSMTIEAEESGAEVKGSVKKEKAEARKIVEETMKKESIEKENGAAKKKNEQVQKKQLKAEIKAEHSGTESKIKQATQNQENKVVHVTEELPVYLL